MKAALIKTRSIKNWVKLASVSLVLFSLFQVNTAQAKTKFDYSQRQEVKQFIDEMVEDHGFDRSYLTNKFANAYRLENILESIARPAEKRLTWKGYRPIFVTDKRSKKGIEFIKKHRDILQRAGKTYGVPVEIIAAVIGVETYYGKQTGKYTVFDSLTTLGFDYPPRGKFFKSELKQFLLLSKEENISVDKMTGSYAGAMGMPQFISSSYRRYAVDFDGDGKRDLWNSLPDVIGSVANYFSVHGWKQGENVAFPATVADKSVLKEKNALKPYETISQFKKQGVVFRNAANGKHVAEANSATLLKFEGKNGVEYWLGLDNFYVITRYNHSALYAMAVLQLSKKLKAGLSR